MPLRIAPFNMENLFTHPRVVVDSNLRGGNDYPHTRRLSVVSLDRSPARVRGESEGRSRSPAAQPPGRPPARVPQGPSTPEHRLVDSALRPCPQALRPGYLKNGSNRRRHRRSDSRREGRSGRRAGWPCRRSWDWGLRRGPQARRPARERRAASNRVTACFPTQARPLRRLPPYRCSGWPIEPHPPATPPIGSRSRRSTPWTR